MADLIKRTDTLNQGREKLNTAITDANRAKWDARTAKTKAEQALLKSESTQTQLNEIVIEGDSSVEAAQARVDEEGKIHATLKERVDDGFMKITTQLAQIPTILSPTGSENDSEYLNTAFAHSGEFILKKGTYWIDQDVQIVGNTNITFEQGAVLRKTPTSFSKYYMLNIADADNVTINNAHIIGDVDEHTGTTGEWGHGMNIVNSHNIVVNNAIIEKCWGDGIYIGHEYWGESKKRTGTIIINDVRIDKVRRNGISVCGGEDIRLIRPHISRVDGTFPKAGIDIEPEGEGGVKPFLTNLLIESAVTEECGEVGILFFLTNLRDRGLTSDIQILDHMDKGSKIGLKLDTLNGALDGSIMIDKPVYSKNGLSALYCSGHKSTDTPHVLVRNPVIKDFNTSKSTNEYYNGGIMVVNNPESAKSYNVGNITILNPYIESSIDQAHLSVVLSDFTNNYKVENVKIINPLKLAPPKSNFPLHLNYETTQNCIFQDDFLVGEVRNSTYYTNTLSSYTYSYYHNKGATEEISYHLEEGYMNGLTVTFEVRDWRVMRIVPPSNRSILPHGGNGQAIQSNTVGSKVKLKRQDNHWVIVEQVGNWTVI